MRQSNNSVPTYEQLMAPTVEALKQLGGSGSIDEIYEKVVEILRLPDTTLELPHGKSGGSAIRHRLAWTRTFLGRYGLLENSSHGVWALTAKSHSSTVDPKAVLKAYSDDIKARSKAEADASPSLTLEVLESAEPPPDIPWDEALQKILWELHPAAFERLAQRLLRESGFIQVEVTGKSNDGGIDGIGIARISGFLSFHVLFQCKRYQGSITPSQIRDFRGAMQGRTDKGLFITTGTFTREAIKEATRDGAPPIDLIDGEQLVQRLKTLGLGVKIKMVESVEVDKGWFDGL